MNRHVSDMCTRMLFTEFYATSPAEGISLFKYAGEGGLRFEINLRENLMELTAMGVCNC